MEYFLHIRLFFYSLQKGFVCPVVICFCGCMWVYVDEIESGDNLLVKEMAGEGCGSWGWMHPVSLLLLSAVLSGLPYLSVTNGPSVWGWKNGMVNINSHLLIGGWKDMWWVLFPSLRNFLFCVWLWNNPWDRAWEGLYWVQHCLCTYFGGIRHLTWRWPWERLSSACAAIAYRE